MNSTKVLDRLDSLIDDLLIESDVPASSLASMLMAARDAVKDGYHVALARRVWDASNSIRDHDHLPLDYSLSAQDAREPTESRPTNRDQPGQVASSRA